MHTEGSRALQPEEASEDSPVEIDILFQELIPLFMESRREDVAKMHHAIDAQDLKAAAGIAHTLSGVGGSVGFYEVTTLGRSMEAAIRLGDLARLRALTERLHAYLDRVRVTFVEY